MLLQMYVMHLEAQKFQQFFKYTQIKINLSI